MITCEAQKLQNVVNKTLKREFIISLIHFKNFQRTFFA